MHLPLVINFAQSTCLVLLMELKRSMSELFDRMHWNLCPITRDDTAEGSTETPMERNEAERGYSLRISFDVPISRCEMLFAECA